MGRRQSGGVEKPIVLAQGLVLRQGFLLTIFAQPREEMPDHECVAHLIRIPKDKKRNGGTNEQQLGRFSRLRDDASRPHAIVGLVSRT